MGRCPFDNSAFELWFLAHLKYRENKTLALLIRLRISNWRKRIVSNWCVSTIRILHHHESRHTWQACHLISSAFYDKQKRVLWPYSLQKRQDNYLLKSHLLINKINTQIKHRHNKNIQEPPTYVKLSINNMLYQGLT